MCGIIGIMANRVVSQEIYDGLTVLQHRGQDSAGIMTYEDCFHLKKGNGLVRDVFHTKNMIRLRGSVGIGHVRYPTAGSNDAAEAQPFYVNSPFGLAMIHNGNLTNYDELKEEVLKVDLRHLNTKSDSELLLNIFARALREVESSMLTPEHIFKAMEGVFRRLKGSYSVIGIIADYGMIAFRDPYGIRPLCLGKRENGEIIPEYIISSESVAVDTLGYKLIGDIQPGEAVFIDMKRNLFRKQVVKSNWAPCIFEHVYLARPDSILDDVSVYKARMRMGVRLAIHRSMPIPSSAGRTISVMMKPGETALTRTPRSAHSQPSC